jgi:hypothetical protein
VENYTFEISPRCDQRLTFALFGVATPADLIRDRGKSAACVFIMSSHLKMKIK